MGIDWEMCFVVPYRRICVFLDVTRVESNVQQVITQITSQNYQKKAFWNVLYISFRAFIALTSVQPTFVGLIVCDGNFLYSVALVILRQLFLHLCLDCNMWKLPEKWNSHLSLLKHEGIHFYLQHIKFASVKGKWGVEPWDKWDSWEPAGLNAGFTVPHCALKSLKGRVSRSAGELSKFTLFTWQPFWLTTSITAEESQAAG